MVISTRVSADDALCCESGAHSAAANPQPQQRRGAYAAHDLTRMYTISFTQSSMVGVGGVVGRKQGRL